MQTTSARGLLLILFAAVLFSFMAACAKYAAVAGVPHGEITFIRFALGTAALAAAHAAGISKIKPREHKWLLLRGLFGGAAILCYFFAIAHGTLVNSVLLNASYPVFIILFSRVVIGERVPGRVYPLLIVAFAGMTLVIRPQPGNINTADLLALASAVFAGIAILTVRRARASNSTITILFYLNFIGTAMSAVFLTTGAVWPTPRAWLALLGVCLFANAAQGAITYAYRYARASEGGVMIMSQVVFSSIVGATLFGERIDLMFIAGGALVLGSGAAMTWLARKRDADH